MDWNLISDHDCQGTNQSGTYVAFLNSQRRYSLIRCDVPKGVFLGEYETLVEAKERAEGNARKHIIPEGLSAYSKRGEGGDPEEYTHALCGVEVVRYLDDGYYFTPTMAKHLMTNSSDDAWCQACLRAIG